MAMITESILPFHGLVALPDELLYDIIQRSGVDPFTLRLVSRQFKYLVQQLPALWTSIRWEGHLSMVRLKRSLEFSGNCLLDVDLTVESNTDVERFLQALPRQRWDRIRSLKIRCAPKQRKALWVHLGGIQLPQLRRLKFYGFMFNNKATCTDMYPFYNHWFAPKLNTIRAVDELLQPVNGMVLRELDFDFELPYTQLTVCRIHALLDAVPNLERLSVQIVFWSILRVDERRKFRAIELLNLKSVSYKFGTDNGSTFSQVPQIPFIDNLVVPNVEFINIRVDGFSVEDLLHLLGMFSDPITRTPRFPNALTLKFVYDYGVRDNIIFDMISILPNLRHLTLHLASPLPRDYTTSVYHPHPRLESVCIRVRRHTRRNSFCAWAVQYLLDHWEIIYARSSRKLSFKIVGVSGSLKSHLLDNLGEVVHSYEWESI